MHIRYRPAADDWAALADFQLKHSATMRRAVRVTLWLSAAVVLVVAALVLLTMRSVFFALLTVGAGSLAALGVPRAVKDRMRRQMRGMFDEAYAAGVITDTRLEVRADGVATESPRGSGVIPYTAFSMIDESPTHVFVGMGGASGLIIPRERMLEGDLTAFVRELRSKLPSAAGSA